MKSFLLIYNSLKYIILNFFKFSVYKLTSFDLLLLKYVVGYSDLIFVPLIIILMDPDVRGGVGEVCR